MMGYTDDLAYICNLATADAAVWQNSTAIHAMSAMCEISVTLTKACMLAVRCDLRKQQCLSSPAASCRQLLVSYLALRLIWMP